MRTTTMLRFALFVGLGLGVGGLLGGATGMLIGKALGAGHPEDGFAGFLYGIYIGLPWGALLGAAVAWRLGRRRREASA